MPSPDIALLIAKKVKEKEGDKGDAEDEEMGSYDDVREDAANELFDAIGVPDDKREAAAAALHDYVRACMKGASE